MGVFECTSIQRQFKDKMGSNVMVTELSMLIIIIIRRRMIII